MSLLFRCSLPLVLIVFTTLIAQAEGSSKDSFEQNFFWRKLDISALYVEQQGSSQNTTSALLAWTPEYRLDPQFMVRGNFGITALKDQNPPGHQITFTTLDAELLLNYLYIDHFDIELGGGVQNWTNQGGTKAIFSGDLGYRLPKEYSLGFIGRIFAGYSNCDQIERANEYRVGFGLYF